MAARISESSDSGAEAFVGIAGVTKSFAGARAVDDVTLGIRRGEIFCLLGASGCGKTTLLRLIAGFETPDAGRIRIDGQDMAQTPAYARPVNMMFQSYALFPHMTVAQNVAFGLKQERMRRAEIDGRVAEMLSLVKLEDLARRKPDQLSGGQRQRVALARALVKRPKLLLLDEPLGSLDKQLREHTQFELLKLQERLGVTFVVVTHDQEEAMTLATRIGVMDRGRIVQVGTPREIYEAPSTRFTAEFIGSVNLFEGRLVGGGDAALASRHGIAGDHSLIESTELGGRLLAARPVGAAAGSIVWAAVRPESMTLSREQRSAVSTQRSAIGSQRSAVSSQQSAIGDQRSVAPGDAEREGGGADAGQRVGEGHGGAVNCARGVIREAAYRGGLSVYLVEIESGKTLRVTRPNAPQGSAGPGGVDARFAPGDGVTVTWHASSVVVVAE